MKIVLGVTITLFILSLIFLALVAMLDNEYCLPRKIMGISEIALAISVVLVLTTLLWGAILGKL